MPRFIAMTGVSRGLGRALFDRFVQAGHTVAGCASNAASIHTLRDAAGPPHLLATVDVRDEAQVMSWAEAVVARHGPPDLLINNAGVINRVAPLWELFPDEVDEVIDVNVKGAAHVLRHFVPAMATRGTGVIVNMSSGWGRSTSPGVAPYCASKWAVEGLTRAVAQELPEGLAVVAVNPGIIDTDMLRVAFGEDASRHRDPDTWSATAAPWLLGLDSRHNGKSLTAP